MDRASSGNYNRPGRFARTHRLGALEPFEGLLAFAADEPVTRRVGMEDRTSSGKDNPPVCSPGGAAP